MCSSDLPVDESWWRNGDPDLPHKEPESRRDSRAVDKVMTMNTPYGLEIIENCLSCKLRRKNWFCGLSPDVLKSFSAASHLSTYPGGAILFVEGQAPRGAFVLCSGKVKLSTTSREGKVLILKMAEPGEALGLSAVISATPYSAQALSQRISVGIPRYPRISPGPLLGRQVGSIIAFMDRGARERVPRNQDSFQPHA